MPKNDIKFVILTNLSRIFDSRFSYKSFCVFFLDFIPVHLSNKYARTNISVSV